MELSRRTFCFGLAFTPLVPARPFPAPQNVVDLILSAETQIGVTTRYDPAYVSLSYPNGDVPRDRGVCIDVVVRAYRDAFGFDFQKAIHEDMSARFGDYPQRWGLARPDKNIDHRRVPNLETWLALRGYEKPVEEGWKVGDLITCKLDGRLPHIGIVRADASANGPVRVIHNIGRGTEDDWLFFGQFTDFRRFRFYPDLIA